LGGEGKPWWLTLAACTRNRCRLSRARGRSNQRNRTRGDRDHLTRAFCCWGSASILLALAGILPASDSTA